MAGRGSALSQAAAEYCTWCWPRPRIKRKANSDWEQLNLRTGEWKRLCNRCANARLRNPYSGLLTDILKTMRKIGAAP